MSLNLAALENRMMESDGTLVPWTRVELKRTQRAPKRFGGLHGIRRIRTEVFIEGNSVGFTTTKRIGTVRPVFRR